MASTAASIRSTDTEITELPIEGMTCAACVRRIEKALAAVPGVQNATVNLITEQARVEHDAKGASSEDLVAAIVGAGYRVRTPASTHGPRASVGERTSALEEAQDDE